MLTKFHRMFVLLTYHEESVCRVWKRCQTLGTRKSAECEGLIYDSLPNVQCPNRPQREVPSQLISCWYLLFDLKHLYSTLSSTLSIWFYLVFWDKRCVWYIVDTALWFYDQWINFNLTPYFYSKLSIRLQVFKIA